MPAAKTLRICPKGHRYYKSSDCPVCPICANEDRSNDPFSILSAPARRALQNHGINSLEELSQHSEKEILKFHGMGPGSMPKLRSLLEERRLSFKSE
ncbi:MAG: RNA polymerase alpha subunit C-terminal domain-containing protein [Mucilaginibacter sp.]